MPPKEAFVTRVAIIRFDDRNRYGSNGVPSTVLFGGGKKLIVSCKSPHKHNHWAKVNVPAGFFDTDADNGGGEAAGNQRGELVELWGPVTTQFLALFYFMLFGKPGLYPNRLTCGTIFPRGIVRRSPPTPCLFTRHISLSLACVRRARWGSTRTS